MRTEKTDLVVFVILLTAAVCLCGMAGAAPSGPYYHQIYSATSTDGINWVVNGTLLVDHASVPGAVYFNNKLYLYYVNAEDPAHEKLSVGISEDRGETFTVYDVQITGTNSPYPVDPNPIIDGNQIRLTYLGNFNQGETNKIVTALSSDGVNFMEDGVIFAGDVLDPDLFYDDVAGEWVLFLNTGGLTKATSSAPTGPFTVDPAFSWTAGSISSTHQIGGQYNTYYAGNGICVAEYINGDLSNIADNIVDFLGLTADPTVAIFGSNDYKMFFKTVVEPEAQSSVEITLDKYDYTAGDTMLIDITLANLGDETQSVYFVWQLNIPDYDLHYQIMTKALSLTPGYQQTFTIPMSIGNYGLPFDASWYVALLEPTAPYMVISEAVANWAYVPTAKTQGEIMPEAIAKEIEVAFAKMELDIDNGSFEDVEG